MKNILGTVAKAGAAVLLLKLVGFVIMVGLVIWIVGSLIA